jgi:hypothetical protein
MLESGVLSAKLKGGAFAYSAVISIIISDRMGEHAELQIAS